MPRKHRIRCRLSREDRHGSDNRLGIEVDGVRHEIVLKISELAERLVRNPHDVAADLVEIAACVYGADSAITRGGPADQAMGRRWRRRFDFEVPVRSPKLWSRPEVTSALTETLSFLSDDFYDFTFTESAAPRRFDSYLDFGDDGAFAADEVILFSGGLDSLAGALDELMSRKKSVALVSHHSATKIAAVQRTLIRELRKRTSDRRVLHVPVTAHLTAGANREGTHRTRSFLFAALGIATARIFGRDRLRFYENGVVSLNLPPVGQVVGARATRTTHPQSLSGFGRLFTALFDCPIRVENPFIWHTKRDVLDVIARLDAADLIEAAHSCANVHQRTKMEPHCGRCSQCIDRRFAVLAAGLEAHERAESYAVDLLTGPRVDVRDREMALAYLRHARQLRAMTDGEFMTKFGEVSRALRHFDESPDAVAHRLFELHRRHGADVAGVMDRELASAMSPDAIARLDPRCLLRLAGADMFNVASSETVASVPPRVQSLAPADTMTAGGVKGADQAAFDLVIATGGIQVEIAGLGKFRGATAETLITLAESYLAAAGAGLKLEDYPYRESRPLMKLWGLNSDEAVRRRIYQARSTINRRAERAGQPVPGQNAIIENLPWKGYRLNPSHVRVFRR